jgi:putative MATE family efflux protein
MGIQGAALATTISQVVTSFMSLYFLLFSQSKYRLKWAYLIPDLSIMNSIYKVGIPSSVVSIAMSLVLTVYNNKLAGFGHLALAALGLGFRINGVLVMIFFGIGHGVMPTVGFNYGASNYERLEEVVKSAVRLSAMIGAVSCLLTEIFARPILMAFTNDPELLSIAVPALRIYVATQVLVGPMIVWINMFNGAGKGLTSMVLLLSRQIIFLIPLIYILPVHFGLNGVWMAQPVADLLTFFIVLFWTRKESKTFKRQMTLQLPDVGQI